MVGCAGKAGGCEKVATKRNAAGCLRLAADDSDALSGKRLQGPGFGKVMGAIKGDGFARSLFFQAQGVDGVGVGCFQLRQEEDRSEHIEGESEKTADSLCPVRFA